MIHKLLDPKSIVGTFVFIILVIVLFMILNAMQESPLGQNPSSNQTIAGTLTLIGFFVWLFKE